MNGFEIRAAITEQKHPSNPPNAPHAGRPSTMQERERDKPFKFYVRNHVEVGEEEGEGGGEKKLLSCIPSKLLTLVQKRLCAGASTISITSHTAQPPTFVPRDGGIAPS